MKAKYIIGLTVIVTAIILASVSFKDNLKQYVTIPEAKKTFVDVQVKGSLDLDKIKYDLDSQLLMFTLTDENGEELAVVYSGLKPGNFEQAKEVVAIGKYDGKKFTADKLLIKCPSKYTEEGEQI